MGEINRRYFDALMADKGWSLRRTATEMGMKHSQLSLTFNGGRKLQLDEAASLSKLFGVPLHEVAENAGVMVRPNSGKRVSVIGALRGDGTVDIYGKEVVERASAPGDLPDDAVAVQARTAGSQLDWMDGSVFFCRQARGVDPTAMGRLCLAKVKDGPAVVATLRRGYQEGTVNLCGPYARESVVVEWASPVILTRN